MYIRCPECGRRGQLPDRWVPEARSLRCRKCRALFKPPEFARLAAERVAGAAFDPIAGRGRADEPAPFLTDGYFSAFDDPPVSPRGPAPGDSNYELTFTLTDAEGDSDSDWDAETDELMPEAPSSDEVPVVAAGVAASSRLEPWHHRFIASWGLALIVSALVLIGVSIPIMAYLLWRAFGAGVSLDVPASTLIAGFACAVALLLISVPMILLTASVTELVRDVRRVYEELQHKSSLGRR